MTPIERAVLALEGLSVADAFGEQLLHAGPNTRGIAIGNRTAPPLKGDPRHEVSAPLASRGGADRSPRLGPVGRRWMWTDDTAMAVSIVEVLRANGGIDPALLAAAFARRYHEDPARGYGRGAHEVLAEIANGVPYDTAAGALFGGEGSCGNGGGMRSAPIGAYFADDLDAVVEHASRSAAPTHAHADGIAGAVAVAVAAAAVFAGERDPRALLDVVIARTPVGPTRSGLTRAIPLLRAEPVTVATELGNGSGVIASDTIPFAVWCAATHLADYPGALWACGEVGGDIDTTCAIVGGIVVGAVGLGGIPADWRSSREPLPVR